MRVLVTGATGLLGSAVCAAAAGAGHHVIAGVHHHGATTVDERVPLEVTDPESVRLAIGSADAVVHTAYSKDTQDGWAVNVEGAGTVATACALADAPLVHVSSDVVFGGSPPGSAGYSEGDPADPVDGFEYGRQKATAEEVVRVAHPDATIVRTTLLYELLASSSLEQMVIASTSSERHIAHFTDEFRSPAHVDDVADGIASLLAIDPARWPPVLHLGGPESLSRAQIARALAPHLGLDPQSLATATSDSVPGNRPADLTLDSSLAGELLGYRPRRLEPL